MTHSFPTRRSSDLVNAQLQLNGPDDKWYVKGFIQNVFDANSVTGLYITDQSSGNYTNIFTLEPRRYGIAAGVRFCRRTGSHAKRKTPASLSRRRGFLLPEGRQGDGAALPLPASDFAAAGHATSARPAGIARPDH